MTQQHVRVAGQLVKLVNDLSAKAGDVLLIVNGHCLGVYTSTEFVTSGAPTPAKRGTPVAVKVHSSRVKKSVYKEAADTRDRILALIASSPMTSADICHGLGFAVSDAKARARVTYLLGNLVKQQKINATPVVAGNGFTYVAVASPSTDRST